MQHGAGLRVVDTALRSDEMGFVNEQMQRPLLRRELAGEVGEEPCALTNAHERGIDDGRGVGSGDDFGNGLAVRLASGKSACSPPNTTIL